MDENWGYVALGYTLTAGVLGWYGARLAIRLRRARRAEQRERTAA
jgi:hypothetical protein